MVFVKLIHWDILKRNHWMFTEPDRQSRIFLTLWICMQQLYSFIPQDNGKSVHVEGILSHNYIFAIFKFYLFVLLSAFLWICKLYLIQKSICDMPKKLMDKNLNWLTLYACKYIHFSWIINYTSIFLQIMSNVFKIFSYSFFVTDFKKRL